MYLLSRKIKAMGVKMVLSGEGSDEIFGGQFLVAVSEISFSLQFPAGYLYFHKAPDAASLHQECVRRVKNLHTADCLRANKYAHKFHLSSRIDLTRCVGPRWLGVLRPVSLSSTKPSLKSR